MKRKLLVLLTLCWSVTLFAEKKEVHILSANDMHAAIEAFPQLAAIAGRGKSTRKVLKIVLNTVLKTVWNKLHSTL